MFVRLFRFDHCGRVLLILQLCKDLKSTHSLVDDLSSLLHPCTKRAKLSPSRTQLAQALTSKKASPNLAIQGYLQWSCYCSNPCNQSHMQLVIRWETIGPALLIPIQDEKAHSQVRQIRQIGPFRKAAVNLIARQNPASNLSVIWLEKASWRSS